MNFRQRIEISPYRSIYIVFLLVRVDHCLPLSFRFAKGVSGRSNEDLITLSSLLSSLFSKQRMWGGDSIRCRKVFKCSDTYTVCLDSLRSLKAFGIMAINRIKLLKLAMHEPSILYKERGFGRAAPPRSGEGTFAVY